MKSSVTFLAGNIWLVVWRRLASGWFTTFYFVDFCNLLISAGQHIPQGRQRFIPAYRKLWVGDLFCMFIRRHGALPNRSDTGIARVLKCGNAEVTKCISRKWMLKRIQIWRVICESGNCGSCSKVDYMF